MASANRYSLVHVSDSGDVTYFSLNSTVNGKKVERSKFPLSQLDAFTTRMPSSDNLFMLFEYIYGKNFEDGNFYIQYRQDRENKRIRVAYCDDINLQNISNSNIGSSIVIRDYKFETYVVNFLNALMVDLSLYRFLIMSEEKYLNSYVIKLIDNYFLSVNQQNEENVRFYFRKVSDALSNYRIIRNIEDGRRMYEKKKEVRYDEYPFGDKVLKYCMDDNGQGTLF